MTKLIALLSKIRQSLLHPCILLPEYPFRTDPPIIKTNDEADKLIRHKKIISHIIAQRLSWFDHLHRMTEQRIVRKYINGNRC